MSDDDIKINDATPSDADPASTREADDAAKKPEVNITPEDAASATEEHAEGEQPPLSEDLPLAPSGGSAVSGADDEGATHDPSLDGPKPVDGLGVAGPLEPGEDPASAGVDTGSTRPLETAPAESGTSEPIATAGSDGASGATAPAAAPPEAAPEAAEGDAKPAGEEKPVEAFKPPYEGIHAVAKPLTEALGGEITGDLKDAGNALFKVVEKINAANLEEVQGDAYWILSNFRNQAVGVLAAVEAVFKRVR